MPELPEVQTIISDLNEKIKGDVITGFWSDHKKAIKNNFENFVKEIKGRKILGAERIGKNIFINLSGNKILYIHLKMTGHLLVKNHEARIMNHGGRDYFDDRVNQYVHHIFYLGKNKKMEFSDLRKFAKIVLVDTDKVRELKEIKNLGVDAMSDEFTLKKFQEILENKKNKKIRDILMDQQIISGIGNIYASEILFEAGILPERLVKNLSKEEARLVYKFIRNVLNKAIKLRGTSDSDYRDTSGKPGGFQKVLKVYQRAGKKCLKCGTIITRIKMGQRSAFICPNCQNEITKQTLN
ncbi:MAG: bifunctional DNA-formamidopyrimidine glycosylase/DNA-(apurinic or apyrimidinic site) lyase [Parcubacteria group bacterium]|jgi:formamidopyrimidine-DNA glycosylase